MKVEYSGSKNYVADLCRLFQVNGCKGRQVFQTCTRMFVEDWFLRGGTDWEALERITDVEKNNSIDSDLCFPFDAVVFKFHLADLTVVVSR